MFSNYTQGQGYAQWNHPWGQAPADYQQAQAPWNTQQPDYGSQGQQAWNAQQPQQPWSARQPDWQGQQPWSAQQPLDAQQSSCGAQTWSAYEPIYTGQARQQGGELRADEIESFFAEAPATRETAVRETAQPENLRRNKTVNFILNALTLCVVAFLIAGSTVFAFSNNAEKSLFGYRFYNVLTPSMQPLFKPGDMIFVKLVDPSQVQVGDVVTFNPSTKSDAFLTHRVVGLLPPDEKYPARMVTKGDYNNAEDPPVGLNAVIGTHMFTVPQFGRVVDMMRSNLLLVCICFGALFLLLTVLRAYFAARKQEKENGETVQDSSRPLPDIHAFQANRQCRSPAAYTGGLL